MIQQEAKSYNRVYVRNSYHHATYFTNFQVASVHPDLTENDLRNVFEAFGQITKCQLAKQPYGRGHRYTEGL